MHIFSINHSANHLPQCIRVFQPYKRNSWGSTRWVLLKYNAQSSTRCSTMCQTFHIKRGIQYIALLETFTSWIVVKREIPVIPYLMTCCPVPHTFCVSVFCLTIFVLFCYVLSLYMCVTGYRLVYICSLLVVRVREWEFVQLKRIDKPCRSFLFNTSDKELKVIHSVIFSQIDGSIITNNILFVLLKHCMVPHQL